MAAALRSIDAFERTPSPVISGGQSQRLKAILMDDNMFDRRVICDLSQKSGYDLDFVETTSIAETREALSGQSADIIFLDYRVPDGSGIDFSREISGPSAPPTIIVTGEGDERAAVQSFRAGAVDYLSKNDLTIESFEAAISSALSSRREQSSAATEDENIREELSALRQMVEGNILATKAYFLPVAQHAWWHVQTLADNDRRLEAQRLERVTRKLTGLLDETLLGALTHSRDLPSQTIDLRDVVDAARSDLGKLKSKIRISGLGDMPCITGQRSQIELLIKELLLDAVRSTPPEKSPEILVDFGRDPLGSLILRVTDNGLCLADRQHELAKRSSIIGERYDIRNTQVMAMSLCQAIAEMHGGQFRRKDRETGGCVTMIRFPLAAKATSSMN